MDKYIDAEKLKAEINERLHCNGSFDECGDTAWDYDQGMVAAYNYVLSLIDSLQQEQPEPYFYCKYGGIMPLCSGCKRNHSNSPFKTEEITTWYVPSCGTKQCIDYIRREQPKVDLEKEVVSICETYGITEHLDAELGK